MLTLISIYKISVYKKDEELCPRLFQIGGGKRVRTADLLHAMQARSQLSYTPDIVENINKTLL